MQYGNLRSLKTINTGRLPQVAADKLQTPRQLTNNEYTRVYQYREMSNFFLCRFPTFTVIVTIIIIIFVLVLAQVEHEVRNQAGRWLLMNPRILPLKMKLGEPSVSESQVIAWMVFITHTCRRNYVVCRGFFFLLQSFSIFIKRLCWRTQFSLVQFTVLKTKIWKCPGKLQGKDFRSPK